MTEPLDALIYMYGIVPADAPDPASDLTGIDGASVEIARFGRVGAITSRVDAEVYSDEALNARLDDLAWVGERGLAHERVIDWFAAQGPVIPLSLFSLHRGLERLRSRVAAEEDEFSGLLDRLRGRKEWGIKLWRKSAEAAEGIDRLSPSLQEISEQIDKSPSGRRYLLERKRDAMRVEELRTVSNRVSHELYAGLRQVAVDGTNMPIPPNPAAGDRTLLLHAAFLVDDDHFARFQEVVTEHAGRIAESGFELEFTGPWAPYHFSTPDDD